MDYQTFEQYFLKEGRPTAAYVFSAEDLQERMELIRQKLPEKVRVLYAVKANPFLLPLLKDWVDAFEICSPGEEVLCEKHCVPAGQFVISGVNKQEREIAGALDYCGAESGAVFTIESENQAVLLEKLAAERGRQLPVLIRLTAGNQFGVDEETVFSLIAGRQAQLPHLQIRGLQFYSGTQKKGKKIARELQMLDRLIGEIREKLHFEVRELEYGPGLYVPYFEKEAEEEAAALEQLVNGLEQMEFRGGISLEMGRFIAAGCGYYVSRIADSKISQGTEYLILDGGIHQLNYYGQMMAMKKPYLLSKAEGEERTVCICGSLCTVGDVLARDMTLKDPQKGDILVFTRCGAYSVTEGISHFLSRDLPAVYLYHEKKLTCVREKKELWEDNYGRFA